MDDNNKIIDKIEKLISLSGSSNENKDRAAMMNGGQETERSGKEFRRIKKSVLRAGACYAEGG